MNKPTPQYNRIALYRRHINKLKEKKVIFQSSRDIFISQDNEIYITLPSITQRVGHFQNHIGESGAEIIKYK